MTAPLAARLGPNQPRDRFYQGGQRIAAFRGSGAALPRTPEDWVGSVTTLFGHDRVGLSSLADGRVLAEAIAADPVGWLGHDHVFRYGADPALLVKLLDAGERLPIHAHPSVDFASRHLGLAHGKTEAWVFLEPAEVALGFARDVTPEEVRDWVARQDTRRMWDAMHHLEAAAGDAILVPAGTPHAIGAGALLVELQEPTDLSILMEWEGFAIDGAHDGHLGLGFEVALEALDLAGRSRQQCEALREATAASEGDLLPSAGEFFRATRLRADGTHAAGYSVLVCVRGRATLDCDRGPALDIARGDTLVVPHAAGAWRLRDTEDFEAVRCMPPAP